MGIRIVRVLDLFSGTQSVKKACDIFVKEYLEKYGIVIEIDYIGIDIYSPEEENLILDLSQDDIVNKVVAILPKGWIPDFIWASPVCNKFSITTAVKGGTLYFEKTRQGIKPRTNLGPLKITNFKNYTKEKIQLETALHIKLVNNMVNIIEHYNTNYVIENPYTSYIEHFLPTLIVKNKVSYCMYGYDYKKDTAIYSNCILNLKKCNHNKHVSVIGKHKVKNNSKANYQQRASVPPLLIKQILNIFLG